jgi:hypothetical protein
MDNEELLAEFHDELDSRCAKCSAVALVAVYLVMLALWCLSQQVTP